MTGWTLRSCNVGLHLGVLQSGVIGIVAYGKFLTGVKPPDVIKGAFRSTKMTAVHLLFSNPLNIDWAVLFFVG